MKIQRVILGTAIHVALFLANCGMLSAQEKDTAYANRIRTFNVRTNVLLPLMNAGVAFPVAERWDAGVQVNFPWLGSFNSEMTCIENFSIGLEARYWISKKYAATVNDIQLHKGPYTGLYATGGYYDFGFGGKGRQGEYTGIGLQFGWCWNITGKGLRLEADAAAGALYETGVDYTVTNGTYLIIEKKEKTSGWHAAPLKLSLGLCIPITDKTARNAGR